MFSNILIKYNITIYHKAYQRDRRKAEKKTSLTYHWTITETTDSD